MAAHYRRVRVISVYSGAKIFFEHLKELMPDHYNHNENHNDVENLRDLKFEKIRYIRRWLLILKCYQNGLRPKEMEEITQLKSGTINSYTEQMLKETECGNLVQLFNEALKRNII